MDPHNPGPDEHGWADEYTGGSAAGDPAAHTADGTGGSTLPKGGRTELPGGSTTPAPVRTVDLVAGEYLLTVNPLDGSEVEACPPGARPGPPPKRTPQERDALRRSALPPAPSAPVGNEHPVLERDEERERLKRLLARGRSVRVTGPSGSGRSTLLDAVAADCAGLAPDGVVRLSGINRTPSELLYELFATVHDAPLHRPDRAELLGHVREIGAVVVLDDVEFGGSALDELLDATPECAFLVSATPEVSAPSPDAHLEEVFLAGLSRSACFELLAQVAHRALDEDEEAWAGDLWFESEGLPLRFVQAGALLRQRDALRADPAAFGPGHAAPGDTTAASPGAPAYGHEEPQAGDGTAPDVPLPTLAEAAAPAALLASRMSRSSRDALRYAVALGGECPHQAHLPALTGDTHADAAVGELLAGGLLTPAGGRYRLAAGVATQLENAGYAEDSAERAHAVARHYAWWAGHSSVTPERAASEADAMLAAMAVLVSGEEPGQPSTAVLLARTAAPAFAAALHWGAWERALRHGQEAARIAGEVAEEAYFHHELGVLALCAGHLDRARAELDASIGLRGVLADRRGAVSGRRALALVADKAGGYVHGEGRTGAEATDGGGSGGLAVPTAVSAAFGGPEADTGRTVTAATPGGTGAYRSAAGNERDKGLAGRFAVFAGTRRNVLAAGAGALLVAVLGTVVTLGATSGGDDEGPGPVTSEQSAGEDASDDGFPADRPTDDSTSRPGPSESGSESGSPSASASPSDEESGSESGGPSEPEDPESSESDDTEEPGGPGGGGHDPDEPTDEPSDPDEPTDEPSDPDEPTDEPTTPTPTPSDEESTSASSTASGPPSGAVSDSAGTGPAGTAPAGETTPVI
ncbi:ATP-binding protein [Streptomyces lycii]|uniref:ATP-binding protein n=2 Tax=Streptomyces TaxID=1883 RepID=A0ABQ7FC62_9ACTN|nr:ATP-binding protein [Streptomyces lycii]KAF4406083.1 ATP-binding protein [Streptomyces lycii]